MTPELKKRLMCLRLEVDGGIVDDIILHIEAALAASKISKSRQEAIAKAADDKLAIEQAWDCITKYHQLCKVMRLIEDNTALQAAGYINRLRAAVELPEEEEPKKTDA